MIRQSITSLIITTQFKQGLGPNTTGRMQLKQANGLKIETQQSLLNYLKEKKIFT